MNQEITICRAVWEDICRTLGTEQPEQGGMLGGTGNQITAFYHDTDAATSRSRYYPSAALNRVLRQWDACGINFAGIIHSHQSADLRISAADIAFARNILAANAMEQVLFPIVTSKSDCTECRMTIYAVTENTIKTIPYTII